MTMSTSTAEAATPSAVYYRAAELIAQGWTQFCYARNRNDIRINPLHEEATKWCVSGALIKACSDLNFSFSLLPRGSEYYCDPNWNDAPERTQEEVRGALLEIGAYLLNQGEAKKIMLVEARKLAQIYSEMSAVLKGDHWTQNTVARDDLGNPVSATSENAVRWCIRGAKLKVVQNSPQLYNPDLPWELALRPFRDYHKINIPTSQWNDAPDRCEQDVTDALDELAAYLNSLPDHTVDLNAK